MADDTDGVLEDAKKKYELCREVMSDNMDTGLHGLRFWRLGEQWREADKAKRDKEGRPCMTFNRGPVTARQVVNDARQNKPAIRANPVDDDADVETAQIINGLIRNIEHTSNADVAYDTAVEGAVYNGWGYIGVDIAWSSDDSFEKDIRIVAKPNPLAIFGDPYSQDADSAEWNCAFEVTPLPKDEFKRRYPKAEKVDWEFDFQGEGPEWIDEDAVTVVVYWHREEIQRTIYLLEGPYGDDGELSRFVVDEGRLDDFEYDLAQGIAAIVDQRDVPSHKVTQYVLTAAEILETVEWPGRFIPLIPVYGEDINVEGKRYLRGLLHNSEDAQRNINFWRTTSAEMVGKSPRTPFIGPKKAFVTDAKKWASINTESHAFVTYDGDVPPQRQPLDSGIAAGAMQEAMNSSNDFKDTSGIFNASLGAQGNEVSGKAILARQREGDTGTFHFIDNLSRAIRHTGRIIIDLIPHVYKEARIVRVMGEDYKESYPVPINQDTQALDKNGQGMTEKDEDGNERPIMRVYDLTIGKYDLAVSSGPSFTTRREEAAAQMMQLVQAFPAAAQYMGDLIAKNLDWPGADEIADRMKLLLPPEMRGEDQELPPEIQEALGLLEQFRAENEQLKAAAESDAARMAMERETEAAKMQLERDKAQIDLAKTQANAQTDAAKMQLEREKLALERENLALERARIQQDMVKFQQERVDRGLPEQSNMAEFMLAISESQEQAAVASAAIADVLSRVQQTTDILASSVNNLVEQASAPVSIERQNGKTFVRKGDVTREVVMDANGRPAGLQ